MNYGVKYGCMLRMKGTNKGIMDVANWCGINKFEAVWVKN